MAATVRELKATGFSAHSKTVTNVQWSAAEPERVASASADTTARVWQVRGGAMTCERNTCHSFFLLFSVSRPPKRRSS